MSLRCFMLRSGGGGRAWRRRYAEDESNGAGEGDLEEGGEESPHAESEAQ